MISTAFSVLGIPAATQKPSTGRLLPEGQLEAGLTRIDVERIRSNTDAVRNLLLNLGDLGRKDGGIVMTTSGQVDVETGVKHGADKTSFDPRGPLLAPPALGFHLKGIVQLRVSFASIPSKNDPNTPAIQITARTDTAQAAGTEINSMCGGLREVSRLRPMDWRQEDLLAEGERDRGHQKTKVRT
ncbi:hypothetical protein Hypma_013716 [Hypsizygus marmoreus]|uniref:Uncharacterized protein n=1 Tax=Hypsizygus marmoreus TaxID=39966 RepID=A0A369JBC9_HYPMA|nr:hypothetical protein Hypma_013716 [Hypsizygus marmoreus]